PFSAATSASEVAFAVAIAPSSAEVAFVVAALIDFVSASVALVAAAAIALVSAVVAEPDLSEAVSASSLDFTEYASRSSSMMLSSSALRGVPPERKFFQSFTGLGIDGPHFGKRSG